jgi:hypothetical protein
MTAQQTSVSAAAANPSKFFKSPKDVLVDPNLSRDSKIEILRQWEIDARLMAVADEENMGQGENSHLGAVVTALIALDDENKRPDAEKSGTPTKLGG